MKGFILKNMFLFILLLLFLITLFFNRVKVKEYTITSEKVDTSIKIVFLSDLHNSSYGKDQSKLVKKIRQSSPDIIFMTGDMIDKNSDNKQFEMLVNNIKDIAPIYSVTGNNEFEENAIDKTLKAYKNVELLRFEHRNIEIKNNIITIYGIDDPAVNLNYEEYEKRVKETFVSSDRLKILLVHRSRLIDDNIKFPVDIILSGHTHGGLMKIPFLREGVFSPDGFFPDYTNGLYTYGDQIQIINRGLAKYKFIPRILNNPEIVIINITNT